MQDRFSALVGGYRRFFNQYYVEDPGLFAHLSQGQSPHTHMHGCIDSRVNPELLVDARPGEMTVSRAIAGLILPSSHDGASDSIAAIQFAVEHLGVQNILVKGHSRCGGVRSLVGNIQQQQGLSEVKMWLDFAQAARPENAGERPQEETFHECELRIVRMSLKNLMTYPWIQSAVAQGALRLHGWHFNLESGEMLVYDDRKDRFMPIRDSYRDRIFNAGLNGPGL